MMGAGLHETNVDAERQGAATSVVYEQLHPILHYMGIYRQKLDF